MVSQVDVILTNNSDDFAKLADRAGAAAAIKIATPSELVQAEQIDFLREV